MKTVIVAATLCAACLIPSRAWATDAAVKTSIINASIQPRTKAQPVAINGLAMSLGAVIDLGPTLAFEAALQPLVNFQTQEISRNAVNGTLEWNIVGSSRKYTETSQYGTLTYQGVQALSLLLRGGIQYYQLYLSESSGSLKGSTIGAMGGFSYRYDISAKHAVGFEILTTILSLSNSTEGLESQELEYGLVYRRGI